MDNSTPGEASVIVFPQYDALNTEVERLRTELTTLVSERDTLKLITCKNIETAYLLSLGGLEYQAYELQCAVLRLKRKIELIQAKLNRQEKVDRTEIEKTLDAEFAVYQEKLNKQIEDMNAALAYSKGTILSDEETTELKKLYRGIVKALHPDLNPDLSDAKIKLFHHAVQAYENGDLTTMRVIAAMATAPEPPANDADGIKLLMKEKERLSALVRSVRDSIEQIKCSYPYTLRALVEDEEAIAAKKAELEQSIAQWNEALALYRAKADGMMR